MKRIFILILLVFLLTGCGAEKVEELPKEQEEQVQISEEELQRIAEEERGKLIKASNSSVYYVAANGKRYIFPTEGTFKSWFSDFSDIRELTDEELYEIPLGGNVTYRPGSLIRTDDDKNTYFVDRGGVVRAFASELLLDKLYGENWSQQVDYVPIFYFTNYKIEYPILDPETPPIPQGITIDKDKGFVE